MHYHLEIIMPPTNDVLEKIKEILAPFNEQPEEGEESSHAFWDWYVIGGRYSGQHLLSKYKGKKLDSFYEDLRRNKVTVSGFVDGKEELQPATQIPFVDALWQTHFPEEDGPCPIFKHSGDQYKNSYENICRVADLQEGLECSRLIITNCEFHPEFMIEDSYYNGVSWIDSKWEGSVKDGLKMYSEKTNHYAEEWRQKNEVKPEWLLVTVDYHT